MPRNETETLTVTASSTVPFPPKCAYTGCAVPPDRAVRYGMTEPFSSHVETLCKTHAIELFSRYTGLLGAGLAHWTNLPLSRVDELEVPK